MQQRDIHVTPLPLAAPLALTLGLSGYVAGQQIPLTLDVEELAALLKCHQGSIYRNLSIAPWRLPPPVQREPRQRVIWLASTVFKWLARGAVQTAQQQAIAKDTPIASERPLKKKKGRPTKAEQIRRAQAHKAAGGCNV